VGDAGGAAGLGYQVLEFGLADALWRDAQLVDLVVHAAALDAGDGAVSGDAEMAAHQAAADVAVDVVVVVGAGLHDDVADLPRAGVEHVPVAQHIGDAGFRVVDDAAERAGRGFGVGDADAGRERGLARLAEVLRRFGHHAVGGFVLALDDVGGDLDAADAEALRDHGRLVEPLERRHLFGRVLAVHGELDGDLIGGFAVAVLEADADAVDVGVVEELDRFGAHEALERLEICSGGRRRRARGPRFAAARFSAGLAGLLLGCHGV
jgi:hypothetical protein